MEPTRPERESGKTFPCFRLLALVWEIDVLPITMLLFWHLCLARWRTDPIVSIPIGNMDGAAALIGDRNGFGCPDPSRK